MANKREGRDDEIETLSMEERMMRFQERQLAIQEAQLEQQRAATEVQRAQVKQTAPKSNTAVPKISAYNPRGEKDYPMPKLKCDIYAPWKMTPELHSLDREEVELFNLLEPVDNKPVELSDGSTARVCVVGVRNSITGALEQLALKGPKDEDGHHTPLWTNENKGQWPSLKAILRQLIGEPADSVLTMRAEVAAIARGELAVSVGA